MDRIVAAAIEPDVVGQRRRAHRIVALAIMAMAVPTAGGVELPPPARGGGGIGGATAEGQQILGQRLDLRRRLGRQRLGGIGNGAGIGGHRGERPSALVVRADAVAGDLLDLRYLAAAIEMFVIGQVGDAALRIGAAGAAMADGAVVLEHRPAGGDRGSPQVGIGEDPVRIGAQYRRLRRAMAQSHDGDHRRRDRDHTGRHQPSPPAAIMHRWTVPASFPSSRVPPHFNQGRLAPRRLRR